MGVLARRVHEQLYYIPSAALRVISTPRRIDAVMLDIFPLPNMEKCKTDQSLKRTNPFFSGKLNWITTNFARQARENLLNNPIFIFAGFTAKQRMQSIRSFVGA